MAHALNGQLKDFPLAEDLQFIQQQRKSGRLILTTRAQKAEIGIQRGNIAYVEVDGRTVETQLSRWLQTSGRITGEELTGLQNVSRQMDRSVLETLVAKRFITAEERTEWAHYAAEDLICDLFGWQDGTYEFNTDLPATTPQNIPLNISIEMINMEGMRRTDEWPRLLSRFPSPEIGVSRGQLSLDDIEPGPEHMILEAVPEGEEAISLQSLEKSLPFTRYRIYEVLAAYGDQGYVQFHVEGHTLGVAPVAVVESRPVTASLSVLMVLATLGMVIFSAFLRMGISHGEAALLSGNAGSAMQAKMRFDAEKLRTAAFATRLEKGAWPKSCSSLRWHFSRSELELVRGLDYRLQIQDNEVPAITAEPTLRSRSNP